MRLALNLGYVGNGLDLRNFELAQEADRLGYAVAWVAEAYGSDAVSPLAYLAGKTTHIGLGSAVMQIPARTPAMTAMTAATLDTLSGGRFHLGLGVSGPQVSEGWHGVRFDAPLARTREYVDIVRKALARERLVYDGDHYQLPLPDGPGIPLHLTVRPQHPVPIYLAAVGPRNLRLAGEIADGLLAIFYSPEHSAEIRDQLAAGRIAAGHEPGDPLDGFDLVASVPVAIDDDLDAAADAVRPYTALYVGGMGSRQRNFYNDLAVRMGFEEAAAQIQEHYLAGRPRDAAAAVPTEFIDQTALIGPPERIAERLVRYAQEGVTTLAVAPAAIAPDQKLATVRAMADLIAG